MSYLTLNESAAPSTPAAAKVSVYSDNTANPSVRMKDDGGIDRPLVDVFNASVASQAPAASTRTYITGSALAVPAIKLKVGALLRWRFNITKTAAGVAASTFDVCFGVAGTTADVARISFAKPAGTAAVDEGWVEILATIRTIGATGVAVGEFVLMHNGNTAGHAVVPCVVINTVSAGFDMTVANLIAGVCITSGAADAITIQMVQAELINN